MANSGIPLDAFLIFDNCAIVGLCEFYCNDNRGLPFVDMVQKVCQEMSGVLGTLRHFALSGKLFTTTTILSEFMPENSVIRDYSGFDPIYCEQLKTQLRSEIEGELINGRMIDKLRAMQQAPRSFGAGLSRLSDNDLSLVILALGIANQTKERVYILTNEEDLRGFVSWMKPRPEAKIMCTCTEKIHALHSMAYIDSAHRGCAFSTEQVLDMIAFLLSQQLERTMLYGTTKGGMVSSTLRMIYESVRESGKIKRENAGGKLQ